MDTSRANVCGFSTQAPITTMNEQYLKFAPISITFSNKVQNIIEEHNSQLENIVALQCCLREGCLNFFRLNSSTKEEIKRY